MVTERSNNMGSLQGMKSICDVVGPSESTVLMLIRTEGLPAQKIGGIWVSTKEKIKKWIDDRIDNPVKYINN